MDTKSLLNGQCSSCKAKSGTLCSGCKSVRYCSKEHQTAHWPEHKKMCSAVRKSRQLTEKEEKKLREHPGDWTMPANPFDQPGHFWGWLDTRDYMRARYGLLDNVRKIKTVEAVQAAHDHALDLHRLCRSDNMGIRSMTPALMIRLGKDQEAYDFMKWYATTGDRGDYDWGDMDLPYLDLHNEDVFEDLGVAQWWQLSHQAALTLIKLRLLLDLQSLRNSVAVGPKVPQEILDSIQENLVSNTISANSKIMQDVRDGKDLTPHMDRIKAQLDVLFAKVNESNKFFWPVIVNPGSDLTARPPSYSMGSREEMQLIMQYNYESWEETPKAVAWVRERLRG